MASVASLSKQIVGPIPVDGKELGKIFISKSGVMGNTRVICVGDGPINFQLVLVINGSPLSGFDVIASGGATFVGFIPTQDLTITQFQDLVIKSGVVTTSNRIRNLTILAEVT